MWTEGNPSHTTSQPLAPTAPHQTAPTHEDRSNSLARALPEPARKALQKLTPRQLHELHCSVCEHPLRAIIDEEFLHWISVDSIARKYDVGWRAIYRHAHATGIFDQRYRNLRSALGHIVECANVAIPTSRDVIRAVHHLARINAKGEWIDPPTHVVVSSGNSDKSGACAAVGIASTPSPVKSRPARSKTTVKKNKVISRANR
jgi:hypothetical protein